MNLSINGQYAEETIGTAEKTELDAQFESLAERADKTKLWTEKIVAKTESVLQPNPSKDHSLVGLLVITLSMIDSK